MEQVKVYRSAVINASVETVWQVVKNFNELPKWTGVVSDSVLEGGMQDNSIGCVRVVSLLNPNPQDDRPIREQLIAYDSRNHSFTYKILSGPKPFEYFNEYYATVTLVKITDSNQTFIEWKSEFTCPQGNQEQFEKFAGAVYMKGIKSLQQQFP
ncbi:predicted protein [Naegleria gruberi]|uniref:Predicted protein n=1 Tax=Naegleria gruberi TaxID=5762 RepID=D2VU71_NAEGR|nr:uncharacterized protein NAEGRDRAFT_54921 [Naegleria gruberi]XP_002672324.1 uncharacterized protein NAEGRDRAFT_52278 [Naegleria gruberi]EFC35427.1 predicted protein [Naegleria gruberi]EFC39580.1 predicted protein [Naegleria gruberi]|eukprot:XP_002668171.1 predicted protein [Naegleria gruberi strain NEG-M]